MFLVAGAVFGIWTARVPAVKHHLELSDVQLGVALLGLAAGGLTGMLLVGRLVDRWGSGAVLMPAGLLVGPLLIPVAYASALTALTAALFVLGVAHGTLNIAMNAYAAECQNVYQRPIMSSFHALFSIGGFLGATAGGGLVVAGFDTVPTFITAGVTIAVVAGWACNWTTITPPVAAGTTRDRPDATPLPSVAHGQGRLLGLLGLLAFCTLFAEGAAADWSSVYLHDSLGTSAGVAAAAYAAFSIMMAVGRLTGDRLVLALGPARLVRASGVLATAGIVIGALTGHPIVAIIGFGCLGAGLSCAIPQIYTTTTNLDIPRAGVNLARVVALGYLGFLAGPIIIGATAGLTNLPRAMLILPLLTGFVASAAAVVGKNQSVPPAPLQWAPTPVGAGGAHRQFPVADERGPLGLRWALAVAVSGSVALFTGIVLIGGNETSTIPNRPGMALPGLWEPSTRMPVEGEASAPASEDPSGPAPGASAGPSAPAMDGPTPPYAKPPAAPAKEPQPAASPPDTPPAAPPPTSHPTGPNQSIDAEADGSTKVMGTSFRDVRDGSLATFWSPIGPTGAVSIKWPFPVTVARIIIREAAGGATIRSWRVRNHDTGAVLATGTTARTITFRSTALKKVTFEIVTADGTPRIAEFETFSD